MTKKQNKKIIKDNKGVIAIQTSTNISKEEKILDLATRNIIDTKLPNRYLSVKQAMEYLGIKSEEMIYSWVKEGKLKSYRLGGTGNHRFIEEDLDNFMKGSVQ